MTGPGKLRMFPALILLAACAALSCGDDGTSGPLPDLTIRINESNFNPATRDINVGDVVEWENRFSQTRTVTSGTGPDDPDAGALFDVSLAGYRPGDVVGGRYRHTFTEPDTIPYFSRDVPPGYVGVLGGTLIVSPRPGEGDENR